MDLLAEAQSALRVAIEQLESPLDNDLLLAFNWLKTTTAENQVFIEHYMRADDPADPALHATLAAIVDELIIDGMPPSHLELRELLLPLIDDLPELPQLPHGFHLVLSEIDRFLAQSPPTAIAPVAQSSPEVQQVK